MKHTSIRSFAVSMTFRLSLLIGVATLAQNFAFVSVAQAANNAPDRLLSTLIAGIKAHESKVTSFSGYLADESYRNYDPALGAQDLEADTGANPILKKAPTLSLYFWATDGLRVRRDERSIKCYYKSIARSDSYPDVVTWMTTAPDEFDAFDGETTQMFWSGRGDSYCIYSAEPAHYPEGWNYLLQTALGRDGATGSVDRKEMERQPCRIDGTEYIGGVETYRVATIPTAGGRTTTWWIAPSLDYLVVKQEVNSPKATQPWRTVQIVDKVARVDADTWVPVVFRLVHYLTADASRESWQTVRRLSAVTAEVNQPLAAQLFEVPLPPGTSHWSSVTPPKRAQGDKADFDTQLAQAKQRGEQPNFDAVDMAAFLARVNAGKPAVADTLDLPAQSLIVN